MKKISSAHIEILKQGTVSPDGGNYKFTLPATLDRKDYVIVDDALTRLGGKWNAKKKAHLFAFTPEILLNGVYATGELPESNPLAFFPTPAVGIEAMYALVENSHIEWSDDSFRLKILEPSAGIGAIADYLNTKSDFLDIDLVELSPENQKILQAKGYNPICMSFLDFPVPSDEDKYDYIFMNPPFSVTGDKYAYITHIEHAMKMLKPAGELVAITPNGWTKNKTKKEEAFRNLFALQGNYIATLEKGTFKESGTDIETKVITLYPRRWKDSEINGWRTHSEWEFMLYALQEQKYIDIFEGIINDKGDGLVKSDFAHLAEKIILDNADNDIFLTTEYMDRYLTHLLREAKEEYLCHEEELCICPVPTTEIQNLVPAEVQAEIIRNGGNLFDLMSA